MVNQTRERLTKFGGGRGRGGDVPQGMMLGRRMQVNRVTLADISRVLGTWFNSLQPQSSHHK